MNISVHFELSHKKEDNKWYVEQFSPFKENWKIC